MALYLGLELRIGCYKVGYGRGLGLRSELDLGMGLGYRGQFRGCKVTHGAAFSPFRQQPGRPLRLMQ